MPTGDMPMTDAEVLFTKMGASLTCKSAWRVGKMELPVRPLVIIFQTAMDRITFINMRAVLKDTRIYLDDYLTLLQNRNIGKA